MIHPFQHISDLAEILYLYRIEDIVISPGSRNAPLVNTFYKRFGNKCKSIVDERSAAYYAMGKSLFTKKPTVLICTSGTAAINYAPAVAEAFYQAIPLIILTADRPPELIGQQDNQTIFQDNIYGLNIKTSFTFPHKLENEDDISEANKIINKAVDLSLSERPGPVHINIPLREPLYVTLPEPSEKIFIEKNQIKSGDDLPKEFISDWDNAKSIMVICGQSPPNKNLFDSILKVKKDNRVIVIGEATSNLHQVADISSPDILFGTTDIPSEFFPDLVIYFGGQVVSKKLKNFLRGLKSSNFYFVENSDRNVDTFQNLKSTIRLNPKEALKCVPLQEDKSSEYQKYWKDSYSSQKRKMEEYLQGTSYSDLKIFDIINKFLPDNTILFSGNSSAVRYSLYFDQKEREVHANRGTSGIDGSLSTAVGYASAIDKPVFMVLGDLSFIYDSNALWNRDFPSNLKIVVINNGGGGIFHLIQGPTSSDAFGPYIQAHHPVKIKKLADAFGISYYFCNDITSLKEKLVRLIDHKGSCILEVKSPKNGNPDVTRNFFKHLKN